MDAYSIIITIVSGIIFPILVWQLKSKMAENEKLKREKEEAASKKQTALEEGMKCMLRLHLISEHDKWMEKGYIKTSALESGLAMYKAYKALNGNGTVDHMNAEIADLPVRD